MASHQKCALESLEGNVRVDPEMLAANLAFGSPEEVTDKLKQYEALGVDAFIYYASMGLDMAQQKEAYNYLSTRLCQPLLKVCADRSLTMSLEIRRTIDWTQTTFIEGGKPVDTPTYLYAALAIIRNPWFGRGFVEDLSPEIKEICPAVGKLLTDNLLRLSGGTIEGLVKPLLLGWAARLNTPKL